MIAILADAFVKATILMLLAAGGTLLLRRSSAALRHLVWALACTGVLVLPVASALLPNWKVAAWPNLEAPVTFRAEQISGAPVVNAVVAPRPAHEPAAVTIDAGGPGTPATVAASDAVRFHVTPDWKALIFPLWLGGVTIVLILVAVGMARIAWLDRVTKPVQDENWLLLVEDLSMELGLSRYVRLLRANVPAMPMTWGIRRPAILLPADADQWSDEQRRDVLLHELAHVKRHDFLIQLIARIACAVYWFHPLVWLAATRLREERERACDDQVLRAGATPSLYATHLLEIARRLRAARATALASVAMARPAQLATRLIDVLDASRCRDTLSPRAALPAWLGAIAVVVPLAAVAPRVAEPVTRVGSIDTLRPISAPRVTPKWVVKHAPVSATAVAQPLVRDTLKGCSGTTTHTSSSTTEENDDLMIFTNMGGCSIRLASRGKFKFTPDFSDIASVSSGGYVTIDVDYGEHDRRVTIRSNNERVYKIDGDVKPYDADAKAWLRDVITHLLRQTGYQAEARARWILDTKGIQGLLDEFGQLQGDYTRRIYYQAAVESGTLDEAGYVRLITLAGQTIQSDYELAELLIAVSKQQPLTEQMQAGFATAAKNISSDYERHRVLSAALSRPGLTPAVQASMLDAATDINSDYELATLLIELNDARPIDDKVRPAYFKAASSIESDYEHGRVLKAVVSRQGTSPAMLVDVLNSAQNIQSDYELAEVLILIGANYPLDKTLRPAFFTAASTLDSDYEHGRTLNSVLRGQVPSEVALAVLESAKGLSSDHEMSELLLAVMQHTKLDDATRAAIRTDAATISSQYDRGRVYEALSQE